MKRMIQFAIMIIMLSGSFFPLTGSTSPVGRTPREGDGNDNMGNATRIELNDSAEDTLHNETDFADWYYIEAEAGDVIILNLTVPDTGDLSLTLFNVSGSYLTSSNNVRMGGFEKITFMSNGSKYFLEVYALIGNGSYNLSVRNRSDYTNDNNDYPFSADEIDPPVTIKGEVIEGVDEDDYYKVLAESGDTLQATLAYQPSQNFDLFFLGPEGGNLNSSENFTGVEEIRNTVKEAGWHYIHVSVVWGSGDYILEVVREKANAPPNITSYIPDTDSVAVQEGKSVLFSISVNDPEDDILHYRWTVDRVDFGGSGPEYNFTTDYVGQHSAGKYLVEVFVSDIYNSVNHSWELTVADTNPAPELTVIYPLEDRVTLREGENEVFRIGAEDPDGTIPLIRWYLNGEELPGETTDTYDFRTDHGSAGNYTLTVEAEDSLKSDITVSKTWNVIVTDVDRPPLITPVRPLGHSETDEETPVEFEVNVTDPDGDPPVLTWYLDGEEDRETEGNSYLYVPDYESADAGSHEVRLEAEAGEKVVNYTWKLYVNDVNRLPEITALAPEGNETFKTGDEVEFTVTAGDPDGDNLTYEWEVLETDRVISTKSNFTHRFDKASAYTIRLTVSDGKDHREITREFELFVEDDKEDTPGFQVGLLIGGLAAVVSLALIRRRRAE